MLRIVFGENGVVLSDFNVLRFVDRTIDEYMNSEDNDLEVKISNEITLNAFVLRVIEGKIPEFDVEFYYENTPLKFERFFGVLLPDEETELGLHARIIESVLRLGYEQMQAEQQALLQKEPDMTWERIVGNSYELSGTDFYNWCQEQNLTCKTESVEQNFTGKNKEIWEINVWFEDKFMACFYDDDDNLVRKVIANT